MIRHSALVIALLFANAVTAVAQTGSARIGGVVFDSVRHAPLKGALVVATPDAAAHDTAFHSALSDDNGRFEIGALQQGSYTMTVEHPFVDSSGIMAPAVRLVAREGLNTAMLAIPSVATLRRALCPAALVDTTLGIMLGSVRRLDGSGVANASVVFRWADFDLDRSTLNVTTKQVGASVKTDSAGVFRACGLPRMRPLFVQAQGDSADQSGLLEEQIGETAVLVRDFRISRGLVAAVTSPTTPAAASRVAAQPPTPTRESVSPAGTFIVSGHVEGVSGEKIGSAQVTLLGADKTAATNEAGDFRIAGAPGGTQGIEVLALGYTPKYARIEVNSTMQPLALRMTKTAVLLDSVRVIARQSSPKSRRYKEFDQRVGRDLGRTFTEEQLADMRPLRTTDIFRQVLGTRVIATSTGTVVISSRPPSTGGGCALDVYIDGQHMPVDWNIDDLPPIALHGVEVYMGPGTPAKYKTLCGGVILFWTK